MFIFATFSDLINLHFPSKIDHDVCSNYGNWLYSAGIGNDPRENRKFNMIKQGLDYDNNVCLKISLLLNRRCFCCLMVVMKLVHNVRKPASLTESICFRVTMCDAGSLSCRASEDQTCTRPGPSALLHCHTHKCHWVKRTPPPS